MSPHHPEDGEQQSPERKFTKMRDLVLLMGRVHPERIGGSREEGTPAYWGEELVKILSGLKATGQMEDWQPDLKIKIISRAAPDVRLVRSVGDQGPEVSQPVKLPRRPRPFILALDAYTEGKSWEEVSQVLDRRQEQGTGREKIEDLEDEAVQARTFEDAGDVAEKIHATFGEGVQRNSLTGFLSRVMQHRLDQKISKCADLASLKTVHDEIMRFLESEKGKRYFRKVIFMDILDNAALILGRAMLASAMTKEDVQRVASAIHAHPFSFADLFRAPFDETKEDAMAKIDFLQKLYKVRSERGLDDLRKEVDAYQFKSTEEAPQYRQQVIDFVERKRNVYWPKRLRKYMPQTQNE